MAICVKELTLATHNPQTSAKLLMHLIDEVKESKRSVKQNLTDYIRNSKNNPTANTKIQEADNTLLWANNEIKTAYDASEIKNKAEQIEKAIQGRIPKPVFQKWSGTTEDYPISREQCLQVQAMNLNTTEQLSIVKGFMVDQAKAELLNSLTYSTNPIKDILWLFTNHYGRKNLEIPTIKWNILSVENVKDNSSAEKAINSIRNMLSGLQKIGQLGSHVGKDFVIEIINKLRTTDT